MEQRPVINPARATPGMSTQDVSCGFGPASVINRLKVSPITTASGAMASASMVNWYDSAGSGQVRSRSKWVTGCDTATARLDVISAVPTTLGCQVPIMTRAAKNAPPSGTLYTAPRPAPAAQDSRISRSRAVSVPSVDDVSRPSHVVP